MPPSKRSRRGCDPGAAGVQEKLKKSGTRMLKRRVNRRARLMRRMSREDTQIVPNVSQIPAHQNVGQYDQNEVEEDVTPGAVRVPDMNSINGAAGVQAKLKKSGARLLKRQVNRRARIMYRMSREEDTQIPNVSPISTHKNVGHYDVTPGAVRVAGMHSNGAAGVQESDYLTMGEEYSTEWNSTRRIVLNSMGY